MTCKMLKHESQSWEVRPDELALGSQVLSYLSESFPGSFKFDSEKKRRDIIEFMLQTMGVRITEDGVAEQKANVKTWGGTAVDTAERFRIRSGRHITLARSPSGHSQGGD